MKIEILDEVQSTNEYIKRYLSSGEDVVVVAKRQTGGKGTKGRSFLSNEGGVYLTALNFYRGFFAKDAFLIMAHAATAVCKTAEHFGLAPEIKWPNDVYLAGKKLAGILIENILEGDLVKASIIGIGLNVNNDLGELSDIAISLSAAAGRKIPSEQVKEQLIQNLQKSDGFDDYLARVHFLGSEVTVVEGGKTYPARAVQICTDGRLKVEREGQESCLSAAEISLKFDLK